MLTDILPGHVRKYVYLVYAVLGVVLGGFQVGFLSASTEQPTWIVVALAVYGFVGTALGLTAAANIHRSEDDYYAPTYPPR